MARESYTAADAARALGISLDTLRRWDRDGRIRTERDEANRRVVPASEIDRLRGDRGAEELSARNRFHGVVTDVKVEGLVAQVELLVGKPQHPVLPERQQDMPEYRLRERLTKVDAAHRGAQHRARGFDG